MDVLRRTFDGTLAQDLAFGPQYGDFFDFSLSFESTILTIAPIAVWLAIVPFHIWHYKKRPVVATVGLHFWALSIFSIAHAGIEIGKAVVWGMAPTGAQATFEASAALSALAALALVAMVIFEYRHSLNSSTLNSAMLTILSFVDIIKARSFFLRDGLATVGALSVAAAALKAAIVILQEVPKPRVAELANKGPSSEASCGLWNQAFCFWVNKILLRGTRNPLTMKDLEYLGPDFSSARLDATFEGIWREEDKASRWALVRTTAISLRWLLLAGLLSRMVNSACEWAMIFSLRVTVASLGREDPTWAPKALILGNIAIYALKVFALSMHTFFINKTCSLARGLLTTQIIKKNFALKKNAAKEAKGITLMSTDVEQICDLLLEFPKFFIAIPELAFGLYFVYTIIHAAFILPVVTAIGGCCIAILMNSPMMKSQRYWNEAIQDRVAKMSTILLQIKGIKMIGLENTISKFMQNIRVDETARSLRMRWLRAFAQANGGVQLTITPVIGIIGGVYWTVWKNGVDAPSLFTYLSLISMCIDPLNVIILQLPGLGGAFANFTRIQEFLLEEEQHDPRQLRRNVDQAESLDDKQQLDVDSSDPEKSPTLESPTQILFHNVSIPSLADANNANVLNSVNLNIKASSLNIVIGPVGSGKSVLLSTIIGENSLSEGSIYITTNNMAFCHQVAWIPSSTIRQAIIGENEFDSDWYHVVVKACALDYDISKITDQAMTGNDSGGLLSGGQKQRVALARAVYSKAPILVLDDVLSALDQRTARAVFSRLFAADGLLKKQRRTVILATHSVEWLDEADQAISVQSSGDILVYGSKEDIAAAKAVVMAAQGEHQFADADDEDVNLKVEDDATAKEDEISGMLTSDGNLYRLLFGGVPLWLLICLLLVIVATPIIESTPQLVSRIWLSVDPMAKYFIFIMIVLGVFYTFSNGLLIWLWMIVTIPKIANRLHELFLTSVMTATLPFLTKAQSGALLNRFSQDMTLFSFKMPHTVFAFVIYLVYALVQGAFVIAGSAYTAITIPFLLIAVYVLQNFYLRTSKQMRILDLEAKTPLFSKMTEIALGVDHIRAYGWQQQNMARIYVALDQSQKSFYYMYTVQRWLLVAISLISLVVAVILLAVALFVTNSSSQAGLGLAMMSVINFQAALNSLLIQWTALETSLGAVARLKNFLRDTPVEKDDETASEQPASWPSKGEIEFKNVSASYSPEADARLVLHDLSVKLEAGQSTAIVGRTGSGKSSVVLTLLNFLHHTGSVTIDGVDIAQIPLAQLRHVITTIPQDHVDIPGSVRDNVLPLEIMDAVGARGQGDAELTEVLQTVGLWDHISSHGGLESPIDKMELSAGQRQLISMARAMLHHRKTGSKIVIMDEATSNMDYQTDTKIHEIMETAFANSTRLVVTHRNTVLSHCHALIRMEDGRMVSSGKTSEASSVKEKEQE